MKTRKALLFFIIGLIALSCERNTKNQEKEPVIKTADLDSIHSIAGVFDIEEISILPSPDTKCHLSLAENEKIIDYDVSPAGRIVALVVETKTDSQVQFWKIGQQQITESLPLPDGFVCKAITWHPLANALFVMGAIETEYRILRIQKVNQAWSTTCLFKSQKQLRRLVSCPRPFITGYDSETQKSHYAYRIFFGMENGDNSYRIVSITESGSRFYQVIGPSKTMTSYEEMDADIPPSEIVSGWALPIAFHPAGHKLIWEDKNNSFQVATYDLKAWGDSKPIDTRIKKGGTITPTPNGIGLLHWQKKYAGIDVYTIPEKKSVRQLTDYSFLSTPSSVPDGKGIVGLTKEKSTYTLHYLPIAVPLPDVLNAWMFIRSHEEIALLQKNLGLFRPNHNDQLYKLYETENYYCDGYDKSSPTRPYLVTTDIFWELFGAAYQGLFVIKERDEAIPNFWQFVEKAGDFFTSRESKWEYVFEVLNHLKSTNPSTNQEVLRIRNAIDGISDVTNERYAFSELKPRGHYTSTPEMTNYFMAFRYLTTILSNDEKAINELELLPTDIKRYAETWIKSYSGFIAPSRSQSVWKNQKQTLPSYCKHPKEGKTLFPLSWGFDNEVLYSTIYHPYLPEDRQVKGPEGFRMLPSGLDLASALGSHFAESLLQSDLEKYPPLKKVIKNLRENHRTNANKADFKGNMYNSWLNAIAIQWLDTVSSINGGKDKNLWQTKRLQTGLATWATLRHATVLVNERVAAECGEGGFEEILMRAPRGYVETDPNTFSAIAELFDAAVDYVSIHSKDKTAATESYNAETISLYDGIVARLKESAKEARSFKIMAEKERKGLELSNEENEKILYVARVAEHLFLIFNSLSNKDYALSNPDPMPKITDVSGDGINSPYLMAAVGNSMEWNHIVPFYGRHQLVKGAIYSYYEFESRQLVNDKEWREQVNKQEIPFWIKPFTTTHTAFEMATIGY